MVDLVTEIILVVIIFGLLIFSVINLFIYSREREKLIKAILAKDLKDLTNSEVTEKLNPNAEEKKQAEFLPIDDVTDDLFDKAIETQLKPS